MCDSFQVISKNYNSFLAKPNDNLKILKTIYCKMIQIKTITNCTLCLNYLLSTLLILGMAYTCDIQMAKQKNNPVLMLMPPV